ncbi:DUF2799 domain-containing protein [Vibrio sp. TRT 21S02]|uniref:DUF2799 domain-containing protein n=1 Tax=Vibrio sp. TRT 21S02 TaxID=3418507 RepID=UPI003CE8A8F3
MNFKFLIKLFVTFIVGCSSSPTTYKQVWYKEGYRVGKAGYQENNRITNNLKNKLGNFDELSYSSGFYDGRKVFCKPEYAFSRGISGAKYNGQCEGHKNEVMIKADWERGWQAFISQSFYHF